jgi:hypothetical protein
VNLFCIRCGAPVPPANVDEAEGVARCSACSDVFNFVRRGGAVSAPTTAEALARPAYMHVDRQGRRLLIRWRWFTAANLGMAIFCIAWDSFLIFWYSTAFHSRHTPWLMIVFPIGHLAVGVGLTYATLCGFFNHTAMEISPDGLTVRHGPLPSRGNRQLAASQIRQPFCERSSSMQSSNRNNSTPTYSLSAILNDGSKVKLVRGVRELTDARYLERQIELAMNIAPQPVAGECVD